MKNNEIELYRMLLQTDYASYVKYVHGGRWTLSRFHKYLCNYVQEFIERETGNPYDILVISTPPQHGKSMTVTETLTPPIRPLVIWRRASLKIPFPMPLSAL